MQHVRGNVVAWLARSPVHNLLAGIVGGAITGAVEYFAHNSLLQTHLPRAVPGMVDAAIVAIVVAILIYTLLRQWRIRRTLVLQELDTIAHLNHQLRDAMQIILYSHYAPQENHARAVLEIVDRIEKILTELFPAIGAANCERFPVSSSRVMPGKSASSVQNQPRR